MPQQLAILLCCIAIAGLFYLNRDRSVRNSKALWLPVLWIGLAGSRGVAAWFGMAPGSSPQEALEGSPLDAAIFGSVLAISIVVLATRWNKAKPYLAIIIPILAYSVYCLVSITWSPIPGPALKRWLKDAGDIVMALIIVTDPRPIAALRQLYSRLGFILLPLSIVLIRYTTLGREWDADGNLSNVGVTTNKNSLGLIVFVVSLGALWNVRWLFTNRGGRNRGRRLLAQCILLACGLALLSMAHSSTSLACFALGSTVMLATHSRVMKRSPSRIHLLCMGIIVAGGITAFLGGTGGVAEALGRESDLSGRTVIWGALFPAVSSPIIGTGFDSFWNSPNVLIFQHNLSRMHWYHPEGLNEAHNGYLEVYLNLGWSGVFLIALVLITGYRHACKIARRNPELGSLVLAIIMSSAIYSLTEAGFRTMTPTWVLLLLAIIAASGANAHLFGTLRETDITRNIERERTATQESIERQAAYTEPEVGGGSIRWMEQGASRRII